MIFRRRRIRIEIEQSTLRMGSRPEPAGFEPPLELAREAPTLAPNLVPPPPSVQANLPDATALPPIRRTAHDELSLPLAALPSPKES